MRRFLASLSMAAVGLSSFAMPAMAVKGADLSIVQSGPSSITFGSTAVYTLKIANAGPLTASKIVVKDLVPTGTAFVPSQSSSECKLVGPYVACTLDSLRPGAAYKFAVAFKPTMTVCKPMTFVNYAEVKSATADPDMTNNRTEMKTSVTCSQPKPQCSDQIDNDSDGKVDYPADPGCTSTLDNDEYNAPLPPQCSDGLDNDMDGAKDYPNDFSCSSAIDNDETNPKSKCQDGIDNDGDGKVDMLDAGCANNQDNDEYNVIPPQCSDNIDNDADGKVDYPNDPGCISYTDNDEYNAPLPPQCSDGIDNDMDGAADYPADFSCTSATDTDETNLKAACQDGIDNDGDGNIDMADAGCANNQDNDEFNAPTSEEEFVITVKSTGSADTVVRNQKNVNLLRFEGHAVNEDVLFTSAAFNAQMGSILNGQNYKLWVDTDYSGTVDTVLQGSALPSGGVVTFNAMVGGGYVIPATKTVIFEVHSDIASSVSDPKNLQIQLATMQPMYVQAEDLSTGISYVGIKTNGSCSGTCEITVNTIPSILLTIKDQGNLYVTQDSAPAHMHQLLGGTLESDILRLEMRAEFEPADVTNIRINTVGTTASSVDRFELYTAGATTPFAHATVGGCGSDPVPSPATFCAIMQSMQLVIPKGGITDVIVRPRMKTDEQGAIAGQIVQIRLYPEDTNVTWDGSVAARGAISSNNFSANDGDNLAEGETFIGTNTPTANAQILGRKNVVTLAEYNAIANANPDPNGTNVPTGPASPFGQFRFGSPMNSNTMNGLNKAVLNDVIFNVNAANVAMNAADFKFYNKSNNSSADKATCVAKNFAGVILTGEINGTFVVECANLTSTTVDTENFSGEQSTFVLEGNITNPKIVSSATSVLQASLQNFGTNGADIPTVYGIADQHVRWLDRDTASFTHVWIEYPETVVNSTSYQS